MSSVTGISGYSSHDSDQCESGCKVSYFLSNEQISWCYFSNFQLKYLLLVENKVYLCNKESKKMRNNHFNHVTVLVWAGMISMLVSCSTHRLATAEKPAVHYELTAIEDERIEIDSRFDKSPNAQAVELLNYYKQKVDEIMSPVIGESTHFMEGNAPESDLSNLVADALRFGCKKYAGKEADFSLINFGGLRSTLPAGPVTFGNVFEITPFENTLVIIQMKGSDAIRLFEQMCAIRNGGVSGVNLVNKAGKLASAKIGGKEVDPDRIYTLATIDYVAEGNDGFTVLQDFKDWEMPEGATLRQCFLDYIQDKTAKGEKIDAKIENRFVYQK